MVSSNRYQVPELNGIEGKGEHLREIYWENWAPTQASTFWVVPVFRAVYVMLGQEGWGGGEPRWPLVLDVSRWLLSRLFLEGVLVS